MSEVLNNDELNALIAAVESGTLGDEKDLLWNDEKGCFTHKTKKYGLDGGECTAFFTDPYRCENIEPDMITAAEHIAKSVISGLAERLNNIRDNTIQMEHRQTVNSQFEYWTYSVQANSLIAAIELKPHNSTVFVELHDDLIKALSEKPEDFSDGSHNDFTQYLCNIIAEEFGKALGEKYKADANLISVFYGRPVKVFTPVFGYFEKICWSSIEAFTGQAQGLLNIIMPCVSISPLLYQTVKKVETEQDDSCVSMNNILVGFSGLDDLSKIKRDARYIVKTIVAKENIGAKIKPAAGKTHARGFPYPWALKYDSFDLFMNEQIDGSLYLGSTEVAKIKNLKEIDFEMEFEITESLVSRYASDVNTLSDNLYFDVDCVLHISEKDYNQIIDQFNEGLIFDTDCPVNPSVNLYIRGALQPFFSGRTAIVGNNAAFVCDHASENNFSPVPPFHSRFLWGTIKLSYSQLRSLSSDKIVCFERKIYDPLLFCIFDGYYKVDIHECDLFVIDDTVCIRSSNAVRNGKYQNWYNKSVKHD